VRSFVDFTFQNEISRVIESWRKKWREWRKCVHVGEKENTCKYIKGLVRKPEENDYL
jgi:hypothetical protein